MSKVTSHGLDMPHLQAVLASLEDYATWMEQEIRRREAHAAQLSPRYFALLYVPACVLSTPPGSSGRNPRAHLPHCGAQRLAHVRLAITTTTSTAYSLGMCYDMLGPATQS